MKLLTLKIQNFRCLKGDRNIIDFSKSNILFLIGQNNVGKSTYLRAYEFFVNSKQSATREDFYNYDTDTPIIIEGTFRKEENDDANVDFQGTGRNADPEWVNKWVDAQNLIRIRKTWNGVGLFSKETFDPIQNQWVANGFGGMDSLFTKYGEIGLLGPLHQSAPAAKYSASRQRQDHRDQEPQGGPGFSAVQDRDLRRTRTAPEGRSVHLPLHDCAQRLHAPERGLDVLGKAEIPDHALSRRQSRRDHIPVSLGFGGGRHDRPRQLSRPDCHVQSPASRIRSSSFAFSSFTVSARPISRRTTKEICPPSLFLSLVRAAA